MKSGESELQAKNATVALTWQVQATMNGKWTYISGFVNCPKIEWFRPHDFWKQLRSQTRFNITNVYHTQPNTSFLGWNMSIVQFGKKKVSESSSQILIVSIVLIFISQCSMVKTSKSVWLLPKMEIPPIPEWMISIGKSHWSGCFGGNITPGLITPNGCEKKGVPPRKVSFIITIFGEYPPQTFMAKKKNPGLT